MSQKKQPLAFLDKETTHQNSVSAGAGVCWSCVAAEGKKSDFSFFTWTQIIKKKAQYFWNKCISPLNSEPTVTAWRYLHWLLCTSAVWAGVERKLLIFNLDNGTATIPLRLWSFWPYKDTNFKSIIWFKYRKMPNEKRYLYFFCYSFSRTCMLTGNLALINMFVQQNTAA